MWNAVSLQYAPAAARQIVSRSGLERHAPVSIAKHQLERVMAKHRLDDFGNARKQSANVQHLRDSAQQCGGGVGPHDTNASRRALRPLGIRVQRVRFRQYPSKKLHS